MCLIPISPIQLNAVTVPEDNLIQPELPPEFKDPAEAFNKQKSTELPLHREYDCIIELLTGTMPPPGHTNPLSNSEFKAMKKHIARHFLRVSSGHPHHQLLPNSSLSLRRMEDSMLVLITELLMKLLLSTNTPCH